MGKFLRVLTVFNLIFAAGVLTLGILLFGKREILSGRNKTLEEYAIKIGRTIEASNADAPEVAPEREEQDLGGTMDPTATADPDTFWSTYSTELEDMVEKTVALDDDLRALRSHFLRDEIDNHIIKDETYGNKISSGEGTTQGAMEGLLKRATEQYQILTATRAQLGKTRKYLEDVIASHNQVKMTARQRQGTINDLNAQVAQLNATISGLRNEISMLNDQIMTLEGQIADLESAKRIVEEERDTLKFKTDKLLEANKALQARVDELTRQIAGETTTTIPELGEGDVIMIPAKAIPAAPGEKGQVVAVNEELGFVVMDLDPQFIREIMEYVETFKGRMLPQMDLLVLRDGEFVTKIRIRDLDKSSGKDHFVGDILKSWQQQPIKVGDKIIYKK